MSNSVGVDAHEQLDGDGPQNGYALGSEATSVGPMPGSARSHRPATSRWERYASLFLVSVLFVLVLLPVLAVALAMVRTAPWGDPAGELSLDALARVYTGLPYLTTLAGTILLASIVAGLSVAIGGAFAWILSRTNAPIRSFLEVAVIAPLFLSPFIGAVSWLLLAAPTSGMINVNLRRWLGLPEATFVNVVSFWGVVFVLTLYYIPYAYLFVRGAFQLMDPSLEEASSVNGAGVVATIRRITMPISRPSLAAALLFVGILACGVFSVPAVLGVRMGFVSLPVRIYREVGIFPANYAMGAAVGSMLLIVTIAGIFFYRKSIQRSQRFVTVGARGFRMRRLELGWIRYLAAAAIVGYFLLAVVLPYAALSLVSLSPYPETDLSQLQLSFEGIRSVISSSRVGIAIRNSLTLGVLAATLATMLGVVVALVVNRGSSRLRAAIDYLSALPVAIPGIVFATGVLWVYVYSPIYATIWILLLAYVASYLPFTARIAGNSVMQIDRALEEASTVNGASWMYTVRRVVVPLAKPGLLSAWILVYIFTIREINSAILLYSPRSTVLSVLVWDFVDSGVLRDAAVVGMIQTLLLLAGVLVARFVFRVKLSSAAVRSM